jgi:putative Holliday junction resolvase
VGLDVSPSVVGVARSDPTFVLATPLTIIRRNILNEDVVYAKLKEVLANEGAIAGIVVGWPLTPRGDMDASCFQVQRFTEDLTKHVEWPVTLWDERGTSAFAKQYLGKSWKKKRPFDNFAAMVMLQDFLNEHFEAMER